MKITVTGGAGFIGSAVSQALLAAGHEVRVTDRSIRPGLGMPVEIANLLDREACYPLVAGAAAVVHLGNYPVFRGNDSQKIFCENVTMNMNVFQAAVETGVKKIVFASSVQVISGRALPGRDLPYLPLDGQVPPNPDNPYALSKQVGEVMLAYYAAQVGITAIALRFPSILDDDMLARTVANPHPPMHARQEGLTFLHRRDAAALVEACVRAPVTGFRVYFPAARENKTGQPAAAVIREHYPNVPLRQPLETITTLVDLATIEKETGWSPRFSALPSIPPAAPRA